MSAVVAITAVLLAFATVLFARRRPAYSHLRNTLSELGETGSRDATVVAFGVFLPVGLVTGAIAYLERSSSQSLAGLACAIAVGYCGAALFPCDPGSPLSGSPRQAVHNIAGGVEYIGGAFALWRLGVQSGPMFHAFAIIVAATAVVLSIPALARWRGAVQRVGELALFAGLAAGLWVRKG